MPSAPWIPGSWYWQKIDRAASGGRDILGRRLPFSYALFSSFGIKLAGQEVRIGFARLGQEFDAIARSLAFQETQNEQDKFQKFISPEEYLRVKESLKKKRKLLEKRAREIFKHKR
ncbi:hypothetical protein LCGC14_2787240 [marine sediment metagenome]|uniref:Uncharacterized protein n=1 Tax=marine sediment metagenome TaxID=412755 RepID=A0A0F8YRI5_9ZZZZ